MQSTEVIKILTENQLDLQQMGIKSLALFGSVARNEAKPDSDIDLLIEFYPDKFPRGLAFFPYHLNYQNLVVNMTDKNLGKDWRLYIDDILKCALRIQKRTQGLNLTDFLADEDVIYIVERKVITMGESSDKLFKHFPDIISANPQIPWHQMKDMRNILINNSNDIDYEILWQVVVEDIAPLITALQKQLIINNY